MPSPSLFGALVAKRSGQEALSAWMDKRAEKAGQVLAIEEALLSGRFWRYALRRLTAFVVSRFWTTALHIVELTWLVHVFSAKPFVASLAFQNLTLVVDAGWFGALEGMRRRSRELGPGSDASALASRWLTTATWLGLAVGLVPIGSAVSDWVKTGEPPSLLHIYALVCFARLGADLSLRTYYSGVFAHYRVYRPLWMPLVAPTLLVPGTIVLWPLIGPYAFAAALALTTLVTRVMLYVYTRRAYRMRRIPEPRWELRVRWRIPEGRLVRDALLAGVANTTARIGAVVLVAAIIPSLSAPGVFEDEEDMGMRQFAFALHLASPLLFVAGQWWLVFYHDWKRLEGDAAAALARQLHGRMLVTAALIGAFAWAGASGLVLFFVPLEDTWETLLALAPAMVGLSMWTALQLRVFVRGEFVRQVASAGAMLLALGFALSGEWLGNVTWYAALGAGPWVAIVIALVLSRIESAHARGEVDSVPAWERALGAIDEDVVVWVARTRAQPGTVSARVAALLGDRGAVVRVRSNLVWFERAPFTPRAEWLACGAGTLMELEEHPKLAGKEQVEALREAGVVRGPRPDEEHGLADLARKFVEIFPEGMVVRVGRRPPPTLLDLPASTRQAIWRDAVRAQRGIRGRSGWFVTVYAPRGAAEILYLTRRPVTSEAAGRWHAQIGRVGWRILTAAGRSSA